MTVVAEAMSAALCQVKLVGRATVAGLCRIPVQRKDTSRFLPPGVGCFQDVHRFHCERAASRRSAFASAVPRLLERCP